MMSLNLALVSLPSTEALSFGCSKLFQILLPLGTYVVIQEIPGARAAVRSLLARLSRNDDTQRSEAVFDMLVGFISWKIGCDLGFLLVNTAAAPWSIAFTFAGLIPYAILQYCIYYLVGTKMLVQGRLNPFDESPTPPLPAERRWWQRAIAKFCHEDGNVTSDRVPLRKVFLKPLVDYGSILLTWPLYNVSLLFVQSGEINFAPIVRFNFLAIFAFYVVNVFGYILGYNFGEWLHRQLAPLRGPLTAVGGRTRWQWLQSFRQRYGLTGRWLVATTCGVVAVVAIEPHLAGVIFQLSDRLQHAWFYNFGRVDSVRVAQVQVAVGQRDGEAVPATESLIASFPQQWIAMQLDGPRIADARDFMESL